MRRAALRLAFFSLVTLAMAAPAVAYNVVDTSSTTINCMFSPNPDCSLLATDYVAQFTVPGGSGMGKLTSRISQTVDGRWLYKYRIDMTNVHGITSVPYADQLGIFSWGTLQQYDFNADTIATDEVFNITIGGAGSKKVDWAWLSGGWSYFRVVYRVYAGTVTGTGESSYFFGMVSTQSPVVRTMWLHLDSGWISMQGYAPPPM